MHWQEFDFYQCIIIIIKVKRIEIFGDEVKDGRTKRRLFCAGHTDSARMAVMMGMTRSRCSGGMIRAGIAVLGARSETGGR